jgi:hypothetical protein
MSMRGSAASVHALMAIYEFLELPRSIRRRLEVHSDIGTDIKYHLYQDSGDYIGHNDADRATLRRARR